MPTDVESLIIYAIVAAAAAMLVWGAWAKRKRKSACSGDCKCPGVELKRDPAIQKFLDRAKPRD